MWREPDEIVCDLNAEQAERIRAGLRDLYDAHHGNFDFDTSRLNLARILPILTPELTDEGVEHLTGVICDYERFVPPLTKEERMNAMVEVAVTTQHNYAALATNLFAKSHPELLPALVHAARQRLFGTGDALLGHRRLFSYLLNTKPDFRAQVVAALRDPAFAEVRAWLKPELEEDEWASMEIAKSSGA